MLILGLNAYHGDSSAALVADGQLIAAVEEERFNRIKHWAGFPAQSIRWCLEFAGASISDIDHVALSFNPKANLAKKALFTLLQRPSLSAILDRLQRQGKSLGVKEELAKACHVSPDTLRAQFHNVEHHDAHIASGFLVSPFDEAAILSIDGMGDFVSTVLAKGEGNHYEKLSEVFYPHSLGFLYNAITLYLGFHNYGDEYKVMGLAPYGEPEFLDEFRRIIFPKGDTFELDLDYFRHHKDGISMSWEGGGPKVEPFHSPFLEKRLGPAVPPRGEQGEREQNISASLQRVTEEIIFHCLNRLHEKVGSDNVVMVGGCAMNSVANGKVTLETPFKNVYVPAGAADNGTSFGAAFDVWYRVAGEVLGARGEGRGGDGEASSVRLSESENLRGSADKKSGVFTVSSQESVKSVQSVKSVANHSAPFVLQHAQWGPSFTTAQCRTAASNFPVTVTELPEAQLFTRIVDALCEGKVIGWFQGRAEFGARALGCRSLLADPRREDMRDIINLKIKFREKFRPFAPSILEEYVSEWFEQDAPSPFMEKVFQFRGEGGGEGLGARGEGRGGGNEREVSGVRSENLRKSAQSADTNSGAALSESPVVSRVPAVTHIDGSGRLQTVSRATNPRYYDLIDAFRRRTGVPVLLNTSLNENEPIVNTPEQAIDCFLRTQMDAIVLENLYVCRQ